MDGTTRLRVYNRTKYDIGVTLQNGQQPNIIPGSFMMLSVDDICQIDSMARGKKPFSSGELVAVSSDGKDLKLEELGGYTDQRSPKHYADDEIEANLKKSAGQIRKWLEGIEDPVELYGIWAVASKMDLQQSKLDAIRAKLPEGEVDVEP